MSNGLKTAKGEQCNRVNIGGTTVLHGDPSIKTEKPHTIVLFPGGSVEVARTEDGEYWVHVMKDRERSAPITNVRVDAENGPMDAESATLDDARDVMQSISVMFGAVE